MQAIETKFLGPTDKRGSRIKAVCEAGSLTLECDDALDVEVNHRITAEALAHRLGWDQGFHGKMISGGLSGRGYAHVFTGRD